MPKSNNHIEKELLDVGFVEPDREIHHRLCIAVSAMDGGGKTHFAMSAPGRIAYFNEDKGEEGVIHKFPDKDIIEYRYEIPTYRDMEKRYGGSKDDKAQEKADLKALALPAWNKYMDAWRAAMKSKSVRTIVVDPASAMLKLLRLARFGTVTEVMPLQHGPVNAEYETYLKKVYQVNNKNLILLHRLKKKYVGNTWTGKYETDGYSGIKYVAQVAFNIEYDDDDDLDIEERFDFHITKCRLNPKLKGEVVSYPFNTFPALASMVTGTPPMVWE